MQDSGKMTLVTVVPSEEIGLVNLQARSIAQFFQSDLVGKIILIANDRNEEETLVLMQALRAEYGPHESKVEIVSASDFFTNYDGSKKLTHRLRKSLVTAKFLRIFRGSTGWQEHDGWSVQQALKLLSAKLIKTEFTLLLDCKNIFVNDVSLDDFVSADALPKVEIYDLDSNHRRWLPASLRMMGRREIVGDVTRATQYVTPFCIKTSLLKDVVERIEQTRGELISIFVIRFLNVMFWNIFNYTEFILLNAYILSKDERIEAHFSNEARQTIGFHAASNDEAFQKFLKVIDDPITKSVGLHGVYLARASEKTIEILATVLDEKGLRTRADELQNIAHQIATARASRVKNARKRVKQST